MAVSLGRRSGGVDPDDARMSLIEHLRELRSRTFRSVLAILVAAVAAWFAYQWLFDLVSEPFYAAVRDLETTTDSRQKLVLGGVADPFILQVKVSLVAGIVMASPIWLYQIWAFIMPGLHRHERRWTVVFSAIAGPLFVVGVVLGYVVMPKAFDVLIGFTPAGVDNLVQVDRYLTFVLRVLLVFGVAFEIPLFVVLLNLAGVVRARQLAAARSWIVLGTFVFAAVATPSTDPITMLFLALPMTGLFLVSELIARLVDRRRARGSAEPDYAALEDDETSNI